MAATHKTLKNNVCQSDTSFSLKRDEPEPPQEGGTLLLKQEPADDENLQPPPASENCASAPTFSICSDVHMLNQCWKPTIILHRIDLPQQHVSQDEEQLAQVQQDQEEQEQLLLNREPDSVLVAYIKSEADSEPVLQNRKYLPEYHQQEHISQEETLCNQEEQEPAQVQEKQKDFSTSQEQKQFLPKHDSHTVLLTANEKQSEPCQSEADSKPVLQTKDSLPEYHQQEDQEFKQQHLTNETKSFTSHEDHLPSSASEQAPTLTFQFDEMQHSSQKCQQSFRHEAPSVDQPTEAHKQRHQQSGSVKHMEQKSNNSSNRDTKTKSFGCKDSPVGQQSGTPFNCDVCEKHFNQSVSLKKHTNYHKLKKKHSCETCGKCFVMSLKDDMRILTSEKPHSCQTCGRSFYGKTDLERHIRTHTGEKPHSCEICGKCFNLPSTLVDHINYHKKIKKHSCETCGKCFVTKRELTQHTRTHTGEKPYSCETCGKWFNKQSILKRHMRTHTGEKPYSCEICDTSYALKQTQNRHMRTHR